MKKLSKFNYNLKNSNYLKLTLITLCLIFGFQANAQVVNYKRFANDYPWKISLQANSIDANFNKSKPINTESWNTVPYPSKATIERQLVNYLSFELAFSMNRLKKGQKISGLVTNDNLDILAIDGTFKYSIGKLLNIPIIDPYVGVGMGYSEINSENFSTYNLGGGINIWLADTGLFGDYVYTRDRVVDRLGLTLEAYGKKTINKDIGDNVQFSAGVFFVF